MPRRRKVQCDECGGWARDKGQISWAGLCGECGDRRMVEAREQMQAHSGPIWDRYVTSLEQFAETRAAVRAAELEGAGGS